MPSFITSLINNLPTKEEKMAAMQLWNRSLPICANVGIIEYNRVDGVRFREKVGERFGEGWWRGLEDLARELNEAAGVIKGRGKELEEKALNEDSREGKGPEMNIFETSTGKGKEVEIKILNDTAGKDEEPETKTLDQLAEAATLIETEEGPEIQNSSSPNGESKELQTPTSTSTIEAATTLLSLSSPPTSDPTNLPSTLAFSNPLSALWYLLDRFFSRGPEPSSYFFVALEAAVRLDRTRVHPLHIPAPPAFWTDAADWSVPKVGMTLLLTLAASEKHMFDAFARFSKSLGAPALKVSEMRKNTSVSLRKAVIRAKADALDKRRTTVLGVELRDVRYALLCEEHGKEIEKLFATFGRMFVLGVCPEGAKLWLVGGEGGETGTVWEGNGKVGAGVGGWEEMDEFVRAFEGVAVAEVGVPFALFLSPYN